MHKYSQARLQEALPDWTVYQTSVVAQGERIGKQERNGSKCCNGYEMAGFVKKCLFLYFPIFTLWSSVAFVVVKG